MNTNKNSQSGQGSNVDSSTNSAANRETGSKSTELWAKDIDDDFLSGDNKSKTFANNQNNPSSGYNQSMSPGRNPNIGGDESEYEASTSDDGYGEESTAANEEYRHSTDEAPDSTKRSNPSWRNEADSQDIQ